MEDVGCDPRTYAAKPGQKRRPPCGRVEPLATPDETLGTTAGRLAHNSHNIERAEKISDREGMFACSSKERMMLSDIDNFKLARRSHPANFGDIIQSCVCVEEEICTVRTKRRKKKKKSEIEELTRVTGEGETRSRQEEKK